LKRPTAAAAEKMNVTQQHEHDFYSNDVNNRALLSHVMHAEEQQQQHIGRDDRKSVKRDIPYGKRQPPSRMCASSFGGWCRQEEEEEEE
jgi:hypothetical protein